MIKNMMFCVECGEEKTPYKNGVCISCFTKKNRFSWGPKNIALTNCPHCNSYKYKNTWLSENFDTVIRRIIQDHFKTDLDLKDIYFEIDCKKKQSSEIRCQVQVTGFLADHEIKEKHTVVIYKRKNACDSCSKQYGGYFEAILQIRADNRKLTKKELEDITNMVDKIIKKTDRKTFITDVDKIHGGIDFYLSKQEMAKTITKNLHDQLGGELKTSSKLIGRKEGRNMYRITYLIRLPAYQKGDLISINNLLYSVLSVHGSMIRLMNPTTWEKTVLENKKLKNAIVYTKEKHIKEAIVVSQSDKDIQIMDPKTYKTIEIRKPKNISIDSKTVKIVRLGDKMFLIP